MTGLIKRGSAGSWMFLGTEVCVSDLVKEGHYIEEFARPPYFRMVKLNGEPL